MTTSRSSQPASTSSYLFVEHLAETLEAMEAGRLSLHAVAYRLFARRLRYALAACPRARLAASPVGSMDAVSEAMANRYFDDHGRLPQTGGKAVQFIADRLFERLRKRA